MIIVSGALPSGFTFDPQTGEISGLPMTPGAYSFTIMITDAVGLTNTATFNITIFPNELPIAALTANPISGTAPLSVVFTATATDPDGSIAQYHWDFTGDEAVDLTTTTGAASFTYETPGEYQAQVIVEDNRGAAAMTSTSITVSPPPQVTNKGSHRGCGCGCTLVQVTPVQDFLSNMVPILLILFYVVRKKRS